MTIVMKKHTQTAEQQQKETVRFRFCYVMLTAVSTVIRHCWQFDTCFIIRFLIDRAGKICFKSCMIKMFIKNLYKPNN